MSERDSDKVNAPNILLVRLRRLWKGTLYIAVAAIYVGLISATFFGLNWKASLFLFGLIVLSQIFRFIADEVDRIGWVIASESSGDNDAQSASRYRRWLLLLLVLLIQSPNVALVVFIYQSWTTIAGHVFLALIIVAELLFLEVRHINRSVAFREAIYGSPLGVLTGTQPSNEPVDRGKDQELEERLRVLEKLASDGKISHQAYEKARDKYWVRRVMDAKN